MGISTRCAACKYLRKRCPANCIYSPYFPSNDPKRFEYVHRIYGASNIARMLQRIPVHLREQAADTLYFEAHCRIEDPVYGCVKIIDQVQQELHAAHTKLGQTQAQISLVLDAYGPPPEPISDHQISEASYRSTFVSLFPQQCSDGLLPYDLPTLGLQHVSNQITGVLHH